MVLGRVTMKKLAQRLWLNESGISAIELALISALILVPVLLGSSEIGRRVWVKSELDNAVRVGIEYVMANHLTTVSGTAVQNAAQSATRLGTAVTVSPPSACGTAYSCFGCPTSSGVTLGGTSATTCASGGTAGTYAGLTAQYSYTPLFAGCGGLLPTSVCPVTSAATVMSSFIFTRIQ
jgi:Flp pilus assembly pilin Flp